ncbi:MAG: insulinase family protein [Chitinophagaceae bacterium]|nr:insulinase family protein [Chitinophagaceae bacterium]
MNKKIIMCRNMKILGITLILFTSLHLFGYTNITIPIDPNVKIGTLKNGLTYYIRENKKPEKRAELRLVVNIGSVSEDPNQLGLAHFTEHMAFNGTKNFKKNEIVNYLQSIGVEFGADLNAYTSFDETVYMIPIPTDDEKIVDKGLQILKEWASLVTFDPIELEKERGVVIEEWRLGRGADQRMLDKYLPVIYKGSRYAERLPIGKKEILESFSLETIKKFYKDWYRPDLMAVIVVGDISSSIIEEKIKQTFENIPVSQPLRKKEIYSVPDHQETYVSIVTDKEASYNSVDLLYKFPVEPFLNETDYKNFLKKRMFSEMFNIRLNEKVRTSNPPYIGAFNSFGSSWVRTKDAFLIGAYTNEKGIREAGLAILYEIERVKKYGFSDGELKRLKFDLLKQYESSYKEKDKTESHKYVSEYINHFLKQEPIPGIEWEYNFLKQNIDSITLSEVNTTSRYMTNENRVVIIASVDKNEITLPSETDVIETLNNVSRWNISPYEDKQFNSRLIPILPTPGNIISETKNELLGTTKLVLSNGCIVFLKPTNFKNDEIVMNTWSPGGTSLASDEDYFSAQNAVSIIQESGVGEFSVNDLQKILSGKKVTVSPYIRELSEGIQGNTDKESMETFFQLLYLYATDPKKDEDVFRGFITNQKGFLPSLTANPEYYFLDQSRRFLNNNHFRKGVFPTVSDLDKVSLDKSFAFYKERYADFSDFAFWFVGSFQIEEIKPFINQYIASLPSIKRAETWKDIGARPPKAPSEKEFKKGIDPKSQVILQWETEAPYNKEEAYYLSCLGEVLSIKLIEILREEKGGVYGVGAYGNGSLLPYNAYTFSVKFPCGPQNVNNLITATMEEIKKIQTKGVTPEDLNKIKEAQKRNFEIEVQENSFWIDALRTSYYEKRNPDDILKTIDNINALKSEYIQKVAQKYVSLNKVIKVILNPEK